MNRLNIFSPLWIESAMDAHRKARDNARRRGLS